MFIRSRVNQLHLFVRNSALIALYRTCCFVLGLISSTAQGSDILDELGWQGPDFTCPDIDIPTSGCVPSEPVMLCNVSCDALSVLGGS